MKQARVHHMSTRTAASRVSLAGLFVAIAAFVCAGWMQSVSAAVPTNQVNMIPAGLVNYQGTLLTPANVPYTNGLYDIVFRLYPASSGGTNTALWGSRYKVFVNNGVFGVMLGAAGGTDLTDSTNQFKTTELWKALWFDEAVPVLDFYLGITVLQDQNHNPVAAPAEAVPRQQFLVTPFAARAQQAQYANRSWTNFYVAGSLWVTGGISTFGGINASGNVVASNIAAFGSVLALGPVSGSVFTGSGTNLTGIPKLVGGNVYSGNQVVVSGSYLGVGTNAPRYQLHVNAGQHRNFHVRPHLNFSQGITLSSALDNDTQFSPMQIEGSSLLLNTWSFGNVGIGNTTNPTAKLHVVGDIRLGSSGQYYAPGGEENLRIVRGSCNSSGGIICGSGFTAVRNSVGNYTVTFTTPFSSVPSATASIGAPGVLTSSADTAYPHQITTTNINIVIGVRNVGWFDEPFSFIAVGPR